MKRCKTVEDRISNLPKEISEVILKQLPIIEAVRTSILSTNWRYHWREVSQLVFNEHFFSSVKEKLLFSHNKISEAFISLINKVILAHEGYIHKFVLHTPNGVGFQILANISRWILHFLRNGMNKLVLRFHYVVGFYEPPSQFFSCEQLTHLELAYCEFSLPPGFKGFPSLIVFYLEHIYCPSEELHNLISTCVVLEMLTLKHCYELKHIDLRAPGLKYLVVDSCSPGNLLGTIAALDCVGIEHLCIMDLLLNTNVDFAHRVSNRLQVPLEGLKKMSLGIFCSHFDLPCVLGIIRSCPNLMDLEMSLALHGVRRNESDMVFGEGDHSTLSVLRSVKITTVRGSSIEMAFSKFFLTYSPSLEIMHIERSRLFTNQSVYKMTSTLIEFPKASPKAKIVYSEASWDEVKFNQPSQSFPCIW